MPRDKRKRTVRRPKGRDSLIRSLGAAATDAWLHSDNAVKKRVARLEVAWRDGLQHVFDDIQRIFGNFAVISDAYDTLDINMAAVKSLCIDNGVFTEEDFSGRKDVLIKLLNTERARRQEELEKQQAELEKKKREADENQASPELQRMHKAATDTTDADHFPSEATIFGG